MRDLLVGATGFVGGNLLRKHSFSMKCHSSDIQKYFGSKPELCVYAGVPAAMFLANADPQADLRIMMEARKNMQKIAPKKLVLISSVAVYQDSRNKNENSIMDQDGLSAYGANRLQLEKWVREDFQDALIVRLPALYGVGLKKNFLFDLHTIVPSMLNREKYVYLASVNSLVANGYSLKPNGFYCLKEDADRGALKTFFQNNDFNALSFTDSRSQFQFYNLGRLWADIEKAIAYDLHVVNLCTPPVSAKQVFTYLRGGIDWHNELPKPPFCYDMHSSYSSLLGGQDPYLCTVEEELADIKSFMDSWENER